MAIPLAYRAWRSRPGRRQRQRPAASWTREPTPPERTRRQSDQSKSYDGPCVRRPVRAGSEEGRALAAGAAALRAATRRLSRSFFLRWRSLRHRRVDRDPLPTARAYRRALAASPKARLSKTSPLGCQEPRSHPWIEPTSWQHRVLAVGAKTLFTAQDHPDLQAKPGADAPQG
jgi:hypothetical protein